MKSINGLWVKTVREYLFRNYDVMMLGLYNQQQRTSGLFIRITEYLEWREALGFRALMLIFLLY